MDIYQILKRWFRINYSHLGYSLTPYYNDENLVPRFDILRFGRETEIKELNLEKIMDFSAGDGELRKFNSNGKYNLSLVSLKKFNSSNKLRNKTKRKNIALTISNNLVKLLIICFL